MTRDTKIRVNRAVKNTSAVIAFTATGFGLLSGYTKIVSDISDFRNEIKTRFDKNDADHNDIKIRFSAGTDTMKNERNDINDCEKKIHNLDIIKQNKQYINIKDFSVK